jgi:SMC interacting uncharacterized protein involved in chromosome segregation
MTRLKQLVTINLCNYYISTYNLLMVGNKETTGLKEEFTQTMNLINKCIDLDKLKEVLDIINDNNRPGINLFDEIKNTIK